MGNNSYFMNDKRESRRLIDKVDGDQWVSQYLAPYLSSQSKVLDIGCGPGHLAISVSQQASSVIGVDLHAERFSKTKLPSNVTLQQANARNLPFDDNEFDVSYMRFLLEYLPEKQSVVSEIVRVTKPGGTIVLQDLDGQLMWHYPISDALANMLKEVELLLGSTGFDPFVGRKLFSYMTIAKVLDIRVQVEPYHFIAGAIDETQRLQWALKLDIAKQALTKLKSKHFADKACEEFMKHLESPDVLTYSNMFTVVGTV